MTGDARRRPLGERALRHAARAARRAWPRRSRRSCAFSAIREQRSRGLILLDRARSRRIVPPKKGEKHVMRVVREILGFEAPAVAGRARATHACEEVEHRRVREGCGGGGRPDRHRRGNRAARRGRSRHVARRRSVQRSSSPTSSPRATSSALSLASAKHDVIPVVLVRPPRLTSCPDVGLATFEDLERR